MTDSKFTNARRLTAGDVTVVALTDGVFHVPPTFFPDPAALASITPAPDADGIVAPVDLPIGAFLIPGDEPMLIDAGVGPVDLGGMGVLIGGRLIGEIRQAGYRPEDIATVALSHLHPDHVGWLGEPDGSPVFPAARVFVGRRDWEAFVEQGSDPALTLAPNVLAALTTMFDAGKVELVDDELAITSTVTAVAAHGHTPGHQVFAIQDGAEKLLLLGDAAYCAAQLTHADWDVLSDFDAIGARSVRRRLLAEMRRDGSTAVGCHFEHFEPTRAVAL